MFVNAVLAALVFALAPSHDPCAPRVFPPAGTPVRTNVPLNGPGLLLSGGGTDIDATYTWMHDTIAGMRAKAFGNVVVISAYTETDPYSSYMLPLGPFRSVQKIGVPACATTAELARIAPIVDRADAVFLAGGDQAHYVAWKDSALDAAVRRVWDRNGVVGGTSAGLAVQGEYVYDSVAADRLHPGDDDYEVRASNAVPDPFEPEISFTHGFFAWPPMRNVITDTHFARRDRFGRTVAFLARLEAQRHLKTGTIYALAVDERSAVLVDAHGVGKLAEYTGKGYATQGAWLIHLLSVTQLTKGKPLIATVRVAHLAEPGATVDLYTKRVQGDAYTIVVDGTKTPFYQDPYR